jgi:uncharacterized protein (DUF1778 family)
MYVWCTRVQYMEKTLTIRVSEEDLALWREAAWRRKMTLSSWCRLMMGQAAKQTLEKVPSPE